MGIVIDQGTSVRAADSLLYVQGAGDQVSVGRLMGALGAVGVRPLAYAPEAQTLFDAMTTAGDAPTARRKLTIDYNIKRLKAGNYWDRLKGLYVIGNSEAQWLINWRSPGTKDLTKVGAPTFSANDGVTTNATTKYYNTGIGLQELDPNDHSLFVVSPSGTASTTQNDVGAQDSSNNGLAIILSPAVSGIIAKSFTGSITVGSTVVDLPGVGWVSRQSDASFMAGAHSIKTGTSATSPVTITENPTITILKSGTTYSVRKISLVAVGGGFSEAEAATVAAILRELVNSIRYGEPLVQRVGYGDALIDCDHVVYGLTMAGISTAYSLARQGESVVLVGDWKDKYLSDLGGMPCQGLAWIDASSVSTVSGIYRTLITAVNNDLGVTDTSSQNGCSVPSSRMNLFVRRALDPTRTGGSVPGKDIPVYFTGGVRSVEKVADGSDFKIASFTTMDGRKFTGRYFYGMDYDGDFLPLYGMPYTKGTEAAGSGHESVNGYQSSYIGKPSDGASTFYDIDPYVTPGDSGSGLIADVYAAPTLADGDPDPVQQALNYRLAAVKSTTYPKAPMTGGWQLAAPPGYDPARYERWGRYLDASGITSPQTLFKLDQPIGQNSLFYDLNNGSTHISTDCPNSGEAYGQATTYAARQAVMDDVRNYMQGLFYWILQSGDPRIPATLITNLQAYGLDPKAFLDGDTLFWPNMAYRREPVYQLNSTFKLDGNWLYTGDGTTPSSVKTISCGSYASDRHGGRCIDVGGLMYQQGGYYTSPGLGGPCGTNLRTPIPMEAAMPDKSVCTNYMTATHYSATKVFFGTGRMEFTMALMGQGCGIIGAVARQNGQAVQDVDYPSVRTLFLAEPDTTTPVIPQTH